MYNRNIATDGRIVYWGSTPDGDLCTKTTKKNQKSFQLHSKNPSTEDVIRINVGPSEAFESN